MQMLSRASIIVICPRFAGPLNYCCGLLWARNWVMMMKTLFLVQGCYSWHKIKYLVTCPPLYTETQDIYDAMKYSASALECLHPSIRIRKYDENAPHIQKMYILYKYMCAEIFIPPSELLALSSLCRLLDFSQESALVTQRGIEAPSPIPTLTH